jgi:hypothetical protein
MLDTVGLRPKRSAMYELVSETLLMQCSISDIPMIHQEGSDLL